METIFDFRWMLMFCFFVSTVVFFLWWRRKEFGHTRINPDSFRFCEKIPANPWPLLERRALLVSNCALVAVFLIMTPVFLYGFAEARPPLSLTETLLSVVSVSLCIGFLAQGVILVSKFSRYCWYGLRKIFAREGDHV